MKTTSSPQYHVGSRDWIRGLIMAVGAAVLVVIEETIESGNLDFNWRSIGKTAIIAGLMYIIKNYFEPAKIIVTEVPKDVAKEVKNSDSSLTIETGSQTVTSQTTKP